VESAAGPVDFVDVGTIDCPAGTKMSKLTALPAYSPQPATATTEARQPICGMSAHVPGQPWRK
jgi:hypothetical protein